MTTNSEQHEPPQPPIVNPGDEAPPGTPGTGENICPRCGGRGKTANGEVCSNCGGTGRIIQGIGGA